MCTNEIKNNRYTNKCVLYDGKKKFLCEPCSKKGITNPFRDVNLVEFLDCTICKRNVNYESIFCNTCYHLIHPSCNGLNRAQFELVGKTDEPWSCLNCNKPRNINKKDNSVNINSPKQDEFKTFDDCKICKKKVTGNKTLSCRTCRHWMHKKCIGNFTNNTEFSDFLKYYSDKDWDCPSCTAKILPFILLDDDEFLLELLDIFYKIPYIDKNYYKKY